MVSRRVRRDAGDANGTGALDETGGSAGGIGSDARVRAARTLASRRAGNNRRDASYLPSHMPSTASNAACGPAKTPSAHSASSM